MEPGLAAALEEAASRCQAVGGEHAGRLDADDRRQLVAAFHRAESLAAAALGDALEAVAPARRRELEEQLADERRHVQVFAGWLGEDAGFAPPPPRRRPEHLALGLLLANELAGFCQFHMLLALLDGAPDRAQVEAILADERVHIARLSGWLRPFWPQPRGSELRAALAAFSRRLAGRMHQFFPRAELEPIRAAMVAPIAELIAAVVPAQGAGFHPARAAGIDGAPGH